MRNIHDNIMDLFRWHRLAFSIKGDAVTLIVDCKDQITKQLRRESSSQINTAGIILIGYQLLDEEFYTVCFICKFNEFKYRIICVTIFVGRCTTVTHR